MQNTKPETDAIRSREERLRAALGFTLFSDVFMSVALNDPPAAQYVLRILTGVDDLTVKEVRTQYSMAKVASRGCKLDVLAEDSSGKLYNIEVQKRDTVDHARRTRYYSAMLDSEVLARGSEYNELPDVYIFYLSETDLWKAGRTSCTVKKFFECTDVPYDDGIHVVYVNAAVDDGTPTAKLMQYFKTADPKDSGQGDLSRRIHFLKTEIGGMEVMCDIINSFIEEGKLEERVESVLNLMDSLNCPAEKAMEMLKIPEMEKESCLSLVRQATMQNVR